MAHGKVKRYARRNMDWVTQGVTRHKV
ncbi:uncharacterized protein G2W53_041155 [Senna tora]|uniref:Uncharacterized protein n=1 Tax=Senna tora TaxID=362788 RepID=A0A834SER0_9FABA|nr:uncharacterized protein G2W53_041155 [Senna tora]